MKSLLRSTVLFTALALAFPAVANAFTRMIDVPREARIGATMLDPGRYRLTVDGNKAIFRQGNRVIAEAEGRWETRQRQPVNAVVIGPEGDVLEIRFAGRDTVLVFGE